MKKLSRSLKEKLIFTAWILGLVIAGTLLWSLTASFRTRLTMNSVNSVLSTMDEGKTLLSPASLQAGSNAPFGKWYNISDSNSLFYVFSIMWKGIFVPCAVEISEEGIAADIIPLGNHASQVFRYIPKEHIDVYLHRIVSVYNERKGINQ